MASPKPFQYKLATLLWLTTGCSLLLSLAVSDDTGTVPTVLLGAAGLAILASLAMLPFLVVMHFVSVYFRSQEERHSVDETHTQQ